jgi:predicted O-methyltransferase YrrM
MSAVAGAGFGEALDAVRGVEGWLTDAQARRLWERARALPEGAKIVEIGSYQGRSTIVLAHGAGAGARVVAIDPHAGSDRGPQEIHGTFDEGQADYETFHANLQRAGATGVEHVRRGSQEALSAVQVPVDLLYVDGAHRYRPARADIAHWGARVAPGGTMLIHDAFSANGVMLAQLRLLVLSRTFRYAGRVGSLAEYRRERLTGRRRVANALRQLAQLPWFARNTALKLAIVLRLRPITRILGRPSGEWPY